MLRDNLPKAGRVRYYSTFADAATLQGPIRTSCHLPSHNAVEAKWRERRAWFAVAVVGLHTGE